MASLCRKTSLGRYATSLSASSFCNPPRRQPLGFQTPPTIGTNSRVGSVHLVSTLLHKPSALDPLHQRQRFRFQTPFPTTPTNTAISMSFSGYSTDSNSDQLGASILNAAIPFMWSGLTIFAGLVAVVAGLLYAKQDSLLYYPEIGGIPRRPSQNPRRYRSPSEHQVPFEENMIRCADGVRIHSWLMLRSEDDNNKGNNKQNIDRKIPTIVFFHGNAGMFLIHLIYSLSVSMLIRVLFCSLELDYIYQ